jgi:hypothetical protein
MPVPAGIIGDSNGSTVIALIQMAPQIRGTANLDGPHDPEMSKRQFTGFTISWPKSPEDVGYF